MPNDSRRRIVGVAATQFAPPLYFTDGAAAQGLIDQGEASIKRRLADLEEQFRAATKTRSGRVEWRSAMDFPARFVLAQARCADIIVSGGESPAFSDAFSLASPKDLVMQAGRPLLVVPDRADWLDLRSLLVAWKDTPESRRAVVDALPMLRKAKEITVVEIPEEGDDRAAVAARVSDVAAWLARHGVTATARVSELAGNETHRATGEDRGQCRSWSDRCRRLRSFPLPRVDPRRCHPVSGHANGPMRAAIALTARRSQIDEDAPCTNSLSRPSTAI